MKRHVEFIAFLLALVVGVCAPAKVFGIPSDAAWKGAAALPIVYFAALVALVGTEIFKYVTGRAARESQRLESACRAVASHVEEQCPEIPMSQCGVHIWRVKGRRNQRLERTSSFLLQGERARSGVHWTKGKGVLGWAWKKREEMHENLESVKRCAASEEEWNKLSDRKRLGMTREEAQRTQNYKAVYARPLYERSTTKGDPKVLGILAIDITAPNHFNHLKRATKGPRFVSVIGVCESALHGTNLES